MDEGSATNFDDLYSRMKAERPISLDFSQEPKKPEPTLDEARDDLAKSVSEVAHALFAKRFGPLVGSVTQTTVNAVLKDLDLDNPEIIIQINSEAEWDLDGLGKPTRYEYDLKSVMFHELAHGLGFLSTSSYLFDRTKGQYVGIMEQPTPFDAYLQTQDGNRLADLPSPSFELGQALTNKLVWSGAEAIAANNGEKPLIYAPSNYDAGSSVSHLDEKTFANSGINAVMTPNLEAGEVFNEPGPILLAMMKDLRNKPAPGLAAGVPSEVLNAQALISDSCHSRREKPDQQYRYQ